MGERVHLLRTLPKVNRKPDLTARTSAKSPLIIEQARCFGQLYFDGPREYGYGGYRYDGRWKPVVIDIMEWYKLQPTRGRKPRVLDVGCAKGFLVSDLCYYGFDAFGLDVSHYAVREKPHPDVVGRLHLGTAIDLPFPDRSFDLVLSINTLHNLPREALKHALREIMRVTNGPAFVQVDSYETPEQKAVFEDWVLTAMHHDYPEGWLKLFHEAGYVGDYDWTII